MPILISKLTIGRYLTRVKRGEISVSAACKELGVSRTTFNKWRRENDDFNEAEDGEFMNVEQPETPANKSESLSTAASTTHRGLTTPEALIGALLVFLVFAYANPNIYAGVGEGTGWLMSSTFFAWLWTRTATPEERSRAYRVAILICFLFGSWKAYERYEINTALKQRTQIAPKGNLLSDGAREVSWLKTIMLEISEFQAEVIRRQNEMQLEQILAPNNLISTGKIAVSREKLQRYGAFRQEAFREYEALSRSIAERARSKLKGELLRQFEIGLNEGRALSKKYQASEEERIKTAERFLDLMNLAVVSGQVSIDADGLLVISDAELAGSIEAVEIIFRRITEKQIELAGQMRQSQKKTSEFLEGRSR